jgi:hypothetical protein
MITITDKLTGEIKQYTQEAFVIERDRLLLSWQRSQEALAAAKETEADLRRQCVDFAFDPNKNSGTERIALGNGYEAKAVKKINYGWVKTPEGDKVDKKRIERALDAIEACGNEGVFIAERLIKWTPDLSLTEYKTLADQYKKIIDEVIVTSEGMPTLEIVAPKGKK